MRRAPRILSRAALSLLLVFGLRLSTRAQELGGTGGTKENLDLPFDAIGDEQEEENAPEIVTFYGQTIEGDGIFYVVDHSSTMTDSGELAIAKRELIRNITEFAERVQFGIVFFDANVMKFPASGMPTEATAGMKASAISWVESVPNGWGTCCQQGIAEAIQMVNRSSVQRKVLVYLGDGGGTCPGADEATYLQQTLAAVTALNFQRIQINTIGILNPGPINEDFMRRLAAQNGGTYHRVTH